MSSSKKLNQHASEELCLFPDRRLESSAQIHCEDGGVSCDPRGSLLSQPVGTGVPPR